jgi:hypothetical protein
MGVISGRGEKQTGKGMRETCGMLDRFLHGNCVMVTGPSLEVKVLLSHMWKQVHYRYLCMNAILQQSLGKKSLMEMYILSLKNQEAGG